MKYVIVYWLRNQSKLFSEPQKCEFDVKDLERVVHIATESGYEIESISKVNDEGNENNEDDRC